MSGYYDEVFATYIVTAMISDLEEKKNQGKTLEEVIEELKTELFSKQSNSDSEIVVIGPRDYLCKEELYTGWYQCPKCGYKNVAHKDNYCSGCGAKIEWET